METSRSVARGLRKGRVVAGIATSVLIGLLVLMKFKENTGIKSFQLPEILRQQWTPDASPATSIKATDADNADNANNDDGTLLIPSDLELEKLNEQKKAELYWKYINTIQGMCRNQTRLGSVKLGSGKESCVDHEYLPRKPCLVYSFGSNFEFDFEQAVIDGFGCEVHTFDPTMDLTRKDKVVPGNIHFQLKGLAGHDHVTNKGWEMRTLDTIMRELNHTGRVIDILKIDIEGAEWTSLRQMFQLQTLQRAKQLCLEVHFGHWGGVTSGYQLGVLRDLYQQGLRIFMREHNFYSLRPLRSEYNSQYTSVNEISLINLKYMK